MESILFGSSKGSFTGAIDKQVYSRLQTAEHSTSMKSTHSPWIYKASFCAHCENNSIRRIGENEEREVDVRIIASTNEKSSKDGKKKIGFVKDLFIV